MVNAPAPYGARRPPPKQARYGEPYRDPYGNAGGNVSGSTGGDGWSEPTSVRANYLDERAGRTRRDDRAAPADRDARAGRADRDPRAGRADRDPRAGQPIVPELHERGLPAWGALLVLLVIAAAGGLVDTVSGSQVRGGFNIGIVAASIVAMLVVRRSSMFPVVISPPLVYAGASAAMLYLRSGGLHDKKVLLDGAANWLVYGFPAIASATAAVLIIAGVRMILHR